MAGPRRGGYFCHPRRREYDATQLRPQAKSVCQAELRDQRQQEERRRQDQGSRLYELERQMGELRRQLAESRGEAAPSEGN
jgi:hypothetical protein